MAKRGRPKSSFRGNEDILGDFFNRTGIDRKSVVDQIKNKLEPVPELLLPDPSGNFLIKLAADNHKVSMESLAESEDFKRLIREYLDKAESGDALILSCELTLLKAYSNKLYRKFIASLVFYELLILKDKPNEKIVHFGEKRSKNVNNIEFRNFLNLFPDLKISLIIKCIINNDPAEIHTYLKEFMRLLCISQDLLKKDHSWRRHCKEIHEGMNKEDKKESDRLIRLGTTGFVKALFPIEWITMSLISPEISQTASIYSKIILEVVCGTKVEITEEESLEKGRKKKVWQYKSVEVEVPGSVSSSHIQRLLRLFESRLTNRYYKHLHKKN